MDPKASNYKKYFVKANPQACKYWSAPLPPTMRRPFPIGSPLCGGAVLGIEFLTPGRTEAVRE